PAQMAAEPGLTLTIYTAEPRSPSEEGLRLLASWAATQNSDSPSTTENAGR
ncbi:transcriptional regulator, partial [Streptomyces anulatus]